MNISLSLRSWLICTTLCAGALVAGPAAAASLTVTGWTLGDSVNVAAGGHTGSVNTAEISLAGNGTSGFSYCVDLAQSISGGTSSGWDYRSQAEMSMAVTRAAWLVDNFQPQFNTLGVGRQTAIAALQVAVWEVMADDAGSYDLSSGSFALAAGGASDAVLGLSNSFLAGLGSADLRSYQTNALWVVSPDRQDQILFPHTNPIPEANTLVLYAFGAALVSFALRRKAASE